MTAPDFAALLAARLAPDPGVDVDEILADLDTWLPVLAAEARSSGRVGEDTIDALIGALADEIMRLGGAV